MNANKRTGWRGIALSLALASLLGILVHVTLAGLSTAAADNFPSRGNGDPVSALLSDTDEYTTYLPFISRPCPYQSTRPLLQGTTSLLGEVEILTPTNCTTGLHTETSYDAFGTCGEIPDGVDIWLLVYPPNEQYYPQSPDASKGWPPFCAGGYWQVPVYLGEKGGPSEWFDIVAILADQEASQFLSDWVREGCERGEYWGISPDLLERMAVTEKSYVVVQTVD